MGGSRVRPMDSHEVFKSALKKVSAKQVSAEMSVSLSLVYKWAEPQADGGSGAANPLDRLETLVRLTGDPTPVQWLCERAGGFFMRNPDSAPHAMELIPATNQIVQEFADLLGEIAKSSADHLITPKEAMAIRARWEPLKSVTEGFVKAAEAGKFPQPPLAGGTVS